MLRLLTFIVDNEKYSDEVLSILSQELIVNDSLTGTMFTENGKSFKTNGHHGFAFD